jgi:hypothetical protein
VHPWYRRVHEPLQERSGVYVVSLRADFALKQERELCHECVQDSGIIKKKRVGSAE